MKNKIAIIFGGRGVEHGISLKSAKALIDKIDKGRFEILPVFITQDGAWHILCDTLDISDINSRKLETFPVYLDGQSGFLCEDRVIEVDCALPVLHGDFGEDGVVQGALINAKIPLIGTSLLGGAVCSDKVLTKDVAKSIGIPVLPYVLVNDDIQSVDVEVQKRFDYPIMVKPCDKGSSFGISVVLEGRDLICAIDFAKGQSGRVIVEEYLKEKREIECAYLRTPKGEIVSVGEITYNGSYYGYSEKYQSQEALTATNVNLSSQIIEKIKEYTKALASELSLVMCRCDYFVKGDEVYLNEINTMPGLTEHSLYPALLEKRGVDVNQMLTSLIGVAK